MKAPHDKASLLRFIGMVNFLSPFCENLSSVIRPLTELTKDDMVFMWSEVQNEAFLKAKNILTDAPVLQYFNLDKPVTLQVDASESGLGGTLMQLNDGGKLQPVAYTSSTMTKTEKCYSQIEKECLAITLSTNLTNGYMARQKWKSTLITNPWKSYLKNL